ncbi:uncharacterized protein THITE_2113018 [Thermothielavioides terrestris NRRL 8126]|uniref:Uncharacterized protein n=2 Tax=Thermothielavioides terrestris TaxID=2587410 RepID=G2R1I1_THETT|nr:uncharacterized protein THITE_2113018 [Thermothielavioides terrestris NRRL 8126]AEO65720.1 hypothetical protein THITE_2113018 [Thermothielavioides terrestris NRRL 8126]
MAIVAVFCAGLCKLWWNNRLMKKQEALDKEKRARLEEMRKAGLPAKRANNVPFGVRAIQSGVEVDGIWISRPASLNEGASAKLASSTTLVVGRDSDSQKKGREYSEDEKSVPVSTTSLGTKQSPSAASVLQKVTDSDSLESAQLGVAIPVSKFSTRAKRHSSRPVGGLNEDTLRKLEGQAAAAKPPYDTYVPASPAQRSPRRPSQRSTGSSSEESVDSQPPSVQSTSARSYTSSSHSSRL